MKQLTVNSFEELNERLRHFQGGGGPGWIFRGQTDASWPVRPKAGRPKFYTGKDLGRFNEWRSRAIAYENLPTNDWECMAVAQHHGLATRLLDWSLNPLVAVYFAVNDLEAIDGALYCYFPYLYAQSKVLPLEGFDRVLAYTPRAVTQRIVNQRGVFTIHPNPCEPLHEEVVENPQVERNFFQIRIPSAQKRALLKRLDFYGIGEINLFPDLDGLSRYINWQTQDNAKSHYSKNSADDAD